jgi:hypothetical protein
MSKDFVEFMLRKKDETDDRDIKNQFSNLDIEEMENLTKERLWKTKLKK